MSNNLLIELDAALQAGTIHPNEVMAVAHKHLSVNTSSEEKSHRLMQVLTFIGGGIVFLGVAFWIGQEWRHFGSVAKVLSTLGIALGFFVSAVFVGRESEQHTLSSVFFLLSALLLPLGLGVTYDELGVDSSNFAILTQIAFLLSAVYFSAYCLYKRNLLLFISVFFTTCLFFVLTDWLGNNTPGFFWSNNREDYVFYRFFAAGCTWILLGHAFQDSERAPLTNWFYLFGAGTVLLMGLLLGGWKPNQNIFWELVYPGLALGCVFLSVQLKSRSFLVFGSIGFGAYLCKITAAYFSDSLGWPLALILMGFSLIGIGFAAVKIKNRHLING